MQNFIFHNPTKVVFGKAAEEETGRLCKAEGAKKVLVLYGGGSAVKSGLLGRVLASLDAENIEHCELGGIVPNPRLSKVYEGLALCRKEKVDFLLAVGGGSVIDTAKAIGYGLRYEGDVWDFYCGKAKPASMAPVGSVLTIAAAGSEMSNSSVITNEEGNLKRGIKNDVARPRFAVMNPELTCTLPSFQTANGAVDIMMHTMERYFNKEEGQLLTDEIAEGLMRAVMESAALLKKNPQDYNARANLMWASSLSHNGLTGCGAAEDWACHQIEHELSGMFDCAHGAGLAAVWPAWARAVMAEKPSRFAQFAVKVMGVQPGADDIETAERGIKAMERFYHSIDMPVTIRELGYELNEAQLDELAEKCSFFGERTIGSFKKLNKEDIRKIYEAARG